MGTSGGVMVSKLDQQTFMSDFESDSVSYLYGLVPHLSKKLCKLLKLTSFVGALGGVMVSKLD